MKPQHVLFIYFNQRYHPVHATYSISGCASVLTKYIRIHHMYSKQHEQRTIACTMHRTIWWVTERTHVRVVCVFRAPACGSSHALYTQEML